MNASSVAAIAALSALFFGDELPFRKFVGVVGVLSGLVLLLI